MKAASEAARGRLIASPSRLREDLEAAVRGAEAAQEDLRAAGLQCKTLEMRLEVVGKAERDVRKVLGLLAEVEVRDVEVTQLLLSHSQSHGSFYRRK